jgi:hypothetical protein
MQRQRHLRARHRVRQRLPHGSFGHPAAPP